MESFKVNKLGNKIYSVGDHILKVFFVRKLKEDKNLRHKFHPSIGYVKNL